GKRILRQAGNRQQEKQNEFFHGQKAEQLIRSLSEAVQAEAAVKVTELTVKAVSLVTILEFMSVAWQAQPVVADFRKETVPELATPPVPTLISKAAVPLEATTDGVVPHPEPMVGAL